jgi:hypothetical protein
VLPAVQKCQCLDTYIWKKISLLNAFIFGHWKFILKLHILNIFLLMKVETSITTKKVKKWVFASGNCFRIQSAQKPHPSRIARKGSGSSPNPSKDRFEPILGQSFITFFLHFLDERILAK